ncbi:MAG: Gfo/Idh/MocA family oxidoreductase [Deltaproteobacteria bacterium]|jgi:hypothetical protein|nr:Gfo/Idh/MocA family oxidoreductase [Deltaproteobacteria bacterium]
MTNIVIIGGGNIGLRHLQALLRLKKAPLVITTIDPSQESLIKAEAALEQVMDRRAADIRFSVNLSDCPPNVDLAVIATTSNVRLEVMQSLVKRARVRYMILEKILFPRLAEYHEAAELLKSHGITAWVNCARRYWPCWQYIHKERFPLAAPAHFSLVGGLWSISSSTIHWLDLLSFMTGINGPLTIDISGLDRTIGYNKRPGFVEFFGALQGTLGPYTFDLASSESDFYTILTSPDWHCNLREEIGVSVSMVTETKTPMGAWNRHEENYPVPFQSRLTDIMAEDILTTGQSLLPSYEDSMALHLPLIEAFLTHLNRCGLVTDYCNVT